MLKWQFLRAVFLQGREVDQTCGAGFGQLDMSKKIDVIIIILKQTLSKHGEKMVVQNPVGESEVFLEMRSMQCLTSKLCMGFGRKSNRIYVLHMRFSSFSFDS